MKKLTKILVLLLSVALVCTGLIMVVSANDTAGNVAKVGETEYATLSEALTAAETAEDHKVTLVGDAAMTVAYNVTTDLTIDLGGYTLTSDLFTAFTVDESVTLTITGKGAIKLSGQLVNSTTTENSPVVNVEGTGAGIDVLHTGTKSTLIVSVSAGSYTFKNADINTSAIVDATRGSFYSDYGTAAKVLMTFDNVEYHSTAERTTSECKRFMVMISGNESHLTIKNSKFYSNHSGLHVGFITAASADTEAVLIENSTISCVADYSTQKYPWLLFLERVQGSTWSHKNLVGIVNVKDSLLECDGRTLYGSYESETADADGNVFHSKIVVDNSIVKSVGTNGAGEHNNWLTRYVKVEFKNGSKISVVSSSNIGQNAEGTATVYAGTRINLLTAAEYTNTNLGKCFIAPDGKIMTETTDYKWIYDPIGDPEYPYLFVKIETQEDNTVKYVTGTDADGNNVYYGETLPYYHSNYNFEAIYKITPSDASDEATYNLLRSDLGLAAGATSSKRSDWSDSESYESMQIACKRGSLYRGVTEGNSYLRYCVTPYSVDPTAETRNFVDEASSGADPFFVFGAPNNYATNMARTYGDNRAYVTVLDFDFGTDSELGLYPELKFNSQARSGSDGSNASNNSDYYFNIDKDGNINNKLNDATSDASLNPAGEWNHFTVVIYTDAVTSSTGFVYFFLNGFYMGYDTLCTSTYFKNADTYIMGVRVDILKSSTHYVNSSFAIDNISLKAYNKYLNGETDGATSATTAANYVTAAPAEKYISNPYSIACESQEADINAALADATAAGKVLDITADVIGSQLITTNGVIATNGYKLDIDPESYGAAVSYDVNGNAVYTFNEAYNATIKYNFYIGNDHVNHSDGLYATAEYKMGQTPSYDYVGMKAVLSADGATGVAYLQNGWDSKYVATLTPELLEELNGAEVYAYPTFSEESVALTACVKNSDGTIVKIATNNVEAVSAYAGLADGETLVLLSDVALTGSTFFYNDDPTVTGEGTVDRVVGTSATVAVTNRTVNGVVIDNDYTDEEIATMKAVAQVISLDLNGYNLSLTSKLGGIAVVSNNTVFNCYSSRAGGNIYSRYYGYNKSNTEKPYYISSQRMFSIMDRTYTESYAKAVGIFNAHINIGTVTVGDVTYPGSNMMITGGVLIEGNSGDNSCSINVDGIVAVRGVTDSTGAIMTRYYDGTITIKNSLIINPKANHIVDMKSYSTTATVNETSVNIDVTPFVTFENCALVNNGGNQDLTKENGDIAKLRSLTFINCTTNGRLNPSTNDRSYFGYGNAAAFNASSKLLDNTLVKAAYNVGMTMEGYLQEGTHWIKVQCPLYTSPLAGDASAFNDDVYYYIVDYGYYDAFVAANPDVDAAYIITLPLLTEKLVYASETVTVTYNGLDGEAYMTQTYVKGGNVKAYKSTGKVLNDIALTGADATYTVNALKLTFNGWNADQLVENIQANATVEPTYDVSATVPGLRANLSIYSDFAINLYVPAEYSEYITAITLDGKELVQTPIEVNGVNYNKVTAYREAYAAADNLVITFAITQEYKGQAYNLSCTATINVASYAAKVLALETSTDADKSLMNYMLTYANEASKYFEDGVADATISGMLESVTLTDYEVTGVSSTDFSPVFKSATVDIVSDDLAYVFTLKDGFAGTVTIKLGEKTYTYTVDADDERVIRISGLKIYSFADDLTINASGTIGEEAATITDGVYNLATFTQYHITNAANEASETKAASEACLGLVKALYNYAKNAYAYKYPTA